MVVTTERSSSAILQSLHDLGEFIASVPTPSVTAGHLVPGDYRASSAVHQGRSEQKKMLSMNQATFAHPFGNRMSRWLTFDALLLKSVIQQHFPLQSYSL